MVAPPDTVQLIQPYSSSGTRCVHETAFANIDADMADGAIAAEKYEVGGCQLVGIDFRPLPGGQFVGAARQAQVEHVAIDIIDQSTAVEATVRRVATVPVRRTHQPNRPHQHGIGGDRISWRHN